MRQEDQKSVKLWKPSEETVLRRRSEKILLNACEEQSNNESRELSTGLDDVEVTPSLSRVGTLEQLRLKHNLSGFKREWEIAKITPLKSFDIKGQRHGVLFGEDVGLFFFVFVCLF